MSTDSRVKTVARTALLLALLSAPVAVAEELERFAGVYVLPAGGQLTVTARTEGLVVSPTPAAAVEMTSGKPAELEDDPGPGRRADEFVRAMASGDVGAVAEIIVDRYPVWDQRLVAVFRNWTDTLGSFHDLQVLGTTDVRSTRATFVVLSFTDGEFTMAVIWDGDRVTGYALNGGVEPTDVFRPSDSPAAFSAEGPFGHEKELSFELDRNGEPTALRLSFFGRELIAHPAS